MEAIKVKMVAVGCKILMLMALSAIYGVAAADAPAPGPASDASPFVPTFLASFVAVGFAVLIF